MNGILATVDRELRAYFVSPLAYVILTFMLLINGGVFALIISHLNDPLASGLSPFELFFGGTFLFWLMLLAIVPILTMRLIAEERRSGTIEWLMTAPVSAGQVVAGKFLAAFLFFVFLWLPTVAYVVIVARHGTVDWGPIAAGYLGVLCLGAMFLAVGMFASSFSKSQIVAAIFSFALMLAVLMVIFVESLLPGGLAKDVIGYADMVRHMDELAKGIVDSRRIVYYLSTTVLFLFLTSHVVEAKKWR